MTSLPSDFGLISPLTCLDLSRYLPSQLQRFPQNRPKYIFVFKPSRNHLTCLPGSLTCLSSLHSLDLSHNQLEVFPPCLTSLPSLHFLSLTGNRLHHLPNTLDRLESSLEGLYLAHNCLTYLPTCLADCLHLRELYVDHNPLTHLPASLASLPNLSILSLTHTMVSSLPALPSPSCLRIQAEHCPLLLCVPYLTGASQFLNSFIQTTMWQVPSRPW